MFIAEREKIISGQKLRMTFLDDSSPSLLPPSFCWINHWVLFLSRLMEPC